MTRVPALELVGFGDESLLVNLDSGAYFAVNDAAVEICRMLMGGANEGEIVTRLTERHGLPVLDAHRALAGVIEALNDPAPPAEPVGPLRYRPSQWGYAFYLEGRPVLETRRDGGEIRLVGDTSAAPEIVEGWIRCLAAKIVSLQGVSVLHASACLFDDEVVAICGLSGAGKTTTARALASAGHTLISEDMVVRSRDTEARVYVEAESALRGWAAAIATNLASAPECAVGCAGLGALICVGNTRPLGRLLFLDRARRRGEAFVVETVRPMETLAELLQASFLGSSEPEAWRMFVAENGSLARAVRGARLSVPNGLEALATAASRASL